MVCLVCFGEEDALLVSHLNTWLSCTACILASRGCSCLAWHLTLNRNTSLGAQRYMLCRCHKHRLTYTVIRTPVNSLQPLKPVSLAPSEVFLFSVRCTCLVAFLFSGCSCLVALHADSHLKPIINGGGYCWTRGLMMNRFVRHGGILGAAYLSSS